MHHIVFDTNILRNEHSHSPRMKILKRLIDEELATLYIPEIVKKEFLTQKLSEYSEKLKPKDIIDVNRFFTNNRNMKDKLLKIEELIKEVSIDIKDSIEDEFDDWVNEFHIEILLFNNSKMTDVMENYFSGGTVFKSIKSRKDIPDAMICTSIEELNLEVGVINVLNNDNVFNNYLKTIGGINVYTSIQELLESETIKNDIDMLDKRNNKFALLHSYLSSDVFRNYLEAYLTSKSDVVDYIYLEKDDILNVSILGDYLFYCNVESVDGTTMSNLKINNVELADENQYLLYITFKAKASLRYGTEYFEYLELEDNRERDVELYSMKGDGATILDETRLLEFEGVLSINIYDTDSVNPEEILDYNSIDLDIDEANILPK